MHSNELSGISTKEFNAEALKRINQLNDLVYQIYPQPTGADVGWNGSFVKTSFADQVKFEMNQNDMLNEEHVKINAVHRYQYNLILFPWSCCGEKEICNIFPEISGGTGVSISANDLQIAAGNTILNGNEWTIEGRPIKFKMATMGKWKGFELLSSESGANAALSGSRYVLITRPGMSPYIPVTRKQYLDRAIPFVTKTYDQYIANAEKMDDKTTGDEYKKGFMKDKETILKKYQDALEESTKKKLLDVPAIVFGPGMELISPIFSTEVEDGRMLVTENPNYFRKDLPKYVPQFFILEWSGKDSKKMGENWSYNFRKLIEENFPVDKLQAMIDK
jgi:hypothetical protein